MLEAVIVDRTPARLAAVHHVGPYTGIKDAFGRLAAWAGPAGVIGAETRFIGIYYDDPREVAAEQLRSHACLTIAEGVATPDGIQTLELPGGRHAMIRHRGPYEDLPTTYAWIFDEWFPASGETITGAAFEDYINDPRETPPAELITDIYVRIV